MLCVWSRGFPPTLRVGQVTFVWRSADITSSTREHVTHAREAYDRARPGEETEKPTNEAHLLNLLLAEFVLFLLVIQEGGQLFLLLGHNLLLEFLLICEQSLHLGDTWNMTMKQRKG